MGKPRTFASRDDNHDKVLRCVLDGLDTSGKIKTATGMKQSYVCRILAELADRQLIICIGRFHGRDVWRAAGFKVVQLSDEDNAAATVTRAVRESSISPIPLSRLMGRRA